MGGFLLDWFDWEPVNSKWVAFFATFIIVVIVISIIGKILTKIADFVFLGWLNKFLGGVFSVIKYAFLISVIFLFLEQTNFNGWVVSKEKKEGSRLYGPISQLAPAILPGLLEAYEEMMEDEEPTEDRVPMETHSS